MEKSSLMIIFIILLLSASLVVNSAHATKGWQVKVTPPKSRSMSDQIGKMTICGDHMCKPFEYQNMKKILDRVHKTNSPYFYQKLNKTK
jgi:hypothetical protein